MSVQSELITPALEELGLIGQGQTATAGDSDYAFRRLNRLLDLMKAEGLMIPYPQTRTTWSFGAVPVQTYTVGVGGTVNVARPTKIDTVSFYDTTISPVQEMPLGMPLTDEQWAAIAIKALTSTYPVAAYYNPTFPLANLSFYPIPTSATLMGVLYAPSALPEFSALTDSVSIPPGYREFFVTQIALRLAPGFRREPSASLIKIAAEAKASVEAMNLRMSDQKFPAITLQGNGSSYFDPAFYSGY